MQTKTIRCAIYTRKSTEEGLEQDYNSLHAQRDACAAYILSQAGEGWSLSPEIYDDGGYSGGTMERPALKRLMADIEAKKIDVVVVYKVDRLTRALADFSKIVEVLDRTGSSFVSITQAFNTTTSMGRLTLNVLLSFAQFEREVTGERIRDKITASKKKGLWMGGTPLLGYDPDGRTLKINEQEADAVRWMFARYLEVKSVHQMVKDASAKGICAKRWINRHEVETGGGPLQRGAIYYLLRNRTYIGEIPHKDESYPGQHEAIISRETFDAVQALLDETRRTRKPGKARPAHTGAPLSGLIFDSAGQVMSPVNASRKGGATYRYYVSTAVQKGRKSEAGVHPRVPASQIEDAVLKAVAPLLETNQTSSWDQVRDVIDRIEVQRDVLKIRLDPERATQGILSDVGRMRLAQLDQEQNQPVMICPIQITKRGGLTVLGPNGTDAIIKRTLDPALSSALIRAEAWKRKLLNGEVTRLEDLARAEDINSTYAARMLRVAFLAPDIKEQILEGEISERLTLQNVMRQDVPLDWDEQRALFKA
ncbi:recombinase family protein [Brevundimonas sp.]|uniref:recombinase family protein n=1 Tax=Brevundimonas sp. TaxID=1871086 RepID=UPI00289EFDC2|nr:recombinase family protein [Brevundimonas sp.]